MWTGNPRRLEFSVAHMNSTVLASVNISNFIILALFRISIQTCRQKNPTLIKKFPLTLEITVGHFKWEANTSVGNWELVWSTLIRVGLAAGSPCTVHRRTGSNHPVGGPGRPTRDVIGRALGPHYAPPQGTIAGPPSCSPAGTRPDPHPQL